MLNSFKLQPMKKFMFPKKKWKKNKWCLMSNSYQSPSSEKFYDSEKEKKKKEKNELMFDVKLMSIFKQWESLWFYKIKNKSIKM